MENLINSFGVEIPKKAVKNIEVLIKNGYILEKQRFDLNIIA